MQNGFDDMRTIARREEAYRTERNIIREQARIARNAKDAWAQYFEDEHQSWLEDMEEETANQYRHHLSSGDVFALRIVGGQIQEVAGPLHYREVTKANLEEYNFRGQHEEDFGLCNEPYSGDVEDGTDVW